VIRKYDDSSVPWHNNCDFCCCSTYHRKYLGELFASTDNHTDYLADVLCGIYAHTVYLAGYLQGLADPSRCIWNFKVPWYYLGENRYL
jgi:hypothetical protein